MYVNLSSLVWWNWRKMVLISVRRLTSNTRKEKLRAKTVLSQLEDVAGEKKRKHDIDQYLADDGVIQPVDSLFRNRRERTKRENKVWFSALSGVRVGNKKKNYVRQKKNGRWIFFNTRGRRETRYRRNRKRNIKYLEYLFTYTTLNGRRRKNWKWHNYGGEKIHSYSVQAMCAPKSVSHPRTMERVSPTHPLSFCSKILCSLGEDEKIYIHQ